MSFLYFSRVHRKASANQHSTLHDTHTDNLGGRWRDQNHDLASSDESSDEDSHGEDRSRITVAGAVAEVDVAEGGLADAGGASRACVAGTRGAHAGARTQHEVPGPQSVPTDRCGGVRAACGGRDGRAGSGAAHGMMRGTPMVSTGARSAPQASLEAPRPQQLPARHQRAAPMLIGESHQNMPWKTSKAKENIIGQLKDEESEIHLFIGKYDEKTGKLSTSKQSIKNMPKNTNSPTSPQT